MNTPRISYVTLLVLLGACSSPATPPKSPTNDAEPPATTTTGNGEVMGADRVPPGQKLEEGVKIDSQEGLKPAARPPAE